MNAQKAVIYVHEPTLPIFYKKGDIGDSIKKSRNLIYADRLSHFFTIFEMRVTGTKPSALYCLALKIQNKDPLVYLNLGINYKNQNNDIDALKCFNTCINLNKNFSKAYLYKSLIHLSKSNFKEGWKNYEYRYKFRH